MTRFYDLTLLKTLVTYNPDTGEFYRLIKTSNRIDMNKPISRRLNTGYLHANIGGIKNLLLHRLAWFYMTGKWPESEIDHINGKRDCNIFSNLRLASSSENKMNTTKRRNRSSQYKGVSWQNREKKWRARSFINGKETFLGYFDSERDAGITYNEAAKELFGEFAKLNDIEYTKGEAIKIKRQTGNRLTPPIIQGIVQ